MAACREAIALTPQDWIAHLDLGVSRSTLARWRIETGGDPMPLIAEARLDLARSLAIDANVITLRYVGQVEQTAARWAALQGQDAAPMFAAAEPCSSVQLARHAGPSALIVRANITNPLSARRTRSPAPRPCAACEIRQHSFAAMQRGCEIQHSRAAAGLRRVCRRSLEKGAGGWRSLNAKLW
jgi:hypothetical protein